MDKNPETIIPEIVDEIPTKMKNYGEYIPEGASEFIITMHNDNDNKPMSENDMKELGMIIGGIGAGLLGLGMFLMFLAKNKKQEKLTASTEKPKMIEGGKH